MQSKAKTVKEYLAELPDDRRESLTTVRDVILQNLPPGYEETMNWGMITYQIPPETYPNTYNKQPLMYAALASQKNHMAVYLTSIYSDVETKETFVREYKATGKKLDMGKSCVRFKKLESLPLELIGKAISSMNVQQMIEMMERVHKNAGKKKC
jgi:uncharacterized protein YdhG (YjbR/CyaY superfamily)